MLYHYYLDNHGDQVVEALWAEYIHWYFDWEEDKLQITDSTGKVLTADDCYGAPPFTFKKLQTEGTGFTLIAETPYMTPEGWSTDYEECFRRDWYLDEADHTNIVTDAAVEATCTHTGLTQGSHCADCGVVIEEQQLIPMKAHTLERVARVEPTTSAEGNIEYWTCTVCHKYFSDEAGTHEISQADTIIEKLELTGWQKIDGKWYYYSYGYSASGLKGMTTGMLVVSIIFGLYGLICLIPSIALSVRRVHDVGFSGWTVAVYYILIICVFVFTFSGALKVASMLSVIQMIYGIVLLVFFCLDSKMQTNKWGKSPKYNVG